MKGLSSVRGQTILELIVVIAILVIVVTALTTLALGTLKDAQITRNRNIANQLAQETLEQVRNVREQRGWDYFSNTTDNPVPPVSASNCFIGVVTEDPNPNAKEIPSDPYEDMKWRLDQVGGLNSGICISQAVANPVEISGVDFVRYYTLEDATLGPSSDCPTGCQGRRVNLTIIWNDGGGTHRIENSSLLTERVIL